MLRMILAASVAALAMATAASAEPCADCDPGGGGGGGTGVTAPAAAFTYDNYKLSQTFVGMTSTSTGTVTGYDWDFGDGSAHAAAASTQHQYAKGGVYHVTLTVSNSAGSSSVTHDVTVQNRSPVAAFVASAQDVMTGDEVTFKDGGYDLDGNLGAWAWEFGDGATSSDRNPAHSYAKSGTYTVKLTEWDDQLAGAIATQQITVHDRPPVGAITATPQAPVAGQAVAFSAGASDPDGSVTGYAWSFGAAGASAAAAPQVTFASAGTYPVKLTLTDDEGAQTELATSITVAAAPVAAPAGEGAGAPPVTTPVGEPVTPPVTAPVAPKPRCVRKARYVVRKVHGKRKRFKRIVCVEPAKRRQRG